MLDAASGQRYLRPSEVATHRQQAEHRLAEAEQRLAAEAAARRALADEVARLQAELARLQGYSKD